MLLPCVVIDGASCMPQVLGPQFGSRLFSLGGVRLPFGAASAFAMLLSAAFAASAAALRPRQAAVATEAAAVARGRAASKSPWRDPKTLRLCSLLALSCGLVRSLPLLRPNLISGSNQGS